MLHNMSKLSLILTVVAAVVLAACQPKEKPAEGSAAPQEQREAVDASASTASSDEASIMPDAGIESDAAIDAQAAPVTGDFTGTDVKQDVALFYAKCLETVKKCKTRAEAAARGEGLRRQVQAVYNTPQAYDRFLQEMESPSNLEKAKEIERLQQALPEK